MRSISQVGAHVARRVLGALATVLLLTVVVFAMVQVIPGDEAHVAAGASATPAQVAAMRVHLGLDRSLPVQYVDFLGRLLHGDLGTSVSSHSSIGSAIGQVLPGTIQLVLVAVAIMVVVAVPAATASALRRGRGSDATMRGAVVLTSGLPTFWLALVLQYLLASRLAWFPISGAFAPHIGVPRVTGLTLVDSVLAGSPGALVDGAYHLLLPGLVLSLPFTGQLYRTLRTELIAVADREHIDAARAKGVGPGRLVVHHLLPNAAGPALTVVGVTFGMMMGAAVLVESVFGLNGIGAYLTNAVANADRFAVIGSVLVIGVVVIASSLVVDLLQLVRDPRLRLGRAAA